MNTISGVFNNLPISSAKYPHYLLSISTPHFKKIAVIASIAFSMTATFFILLCYFVQKKLKTPTSCLSIPHNSNCSSLRTSSVFCEGIESGKMRKRASEDHHIDQKEAPANVIGELILDELKTDDENSLLNHDVKSQGQNAPTVTLRKSLDSECAEGYLKGDHQGKSEARKSAQTEEATSPQNKDLSDLESAAAPSKLTQDILQKMKALRTVSRAIPEAPLIKLIDSLQEEHKSDNRSKLTLDIVQKMNALRHVPHAIPADPFIQSIDSQKEHNLHRSLWRIEQEIEKMGTEFPRDQALSVLIKLNAEFAGGLDIVLDADDPDQLMNHFDQILIEYSFVLRKYLEDQYTQIETKNSLIVGDRQEIFGHLEKLKKLLNDQKDRTSFVCACLRQIELFLTYAVFKRPDTLSLDEKRKNHYVILHELFPIVDQHYSLFEKHHPQLALRLKVKLANLPLISAFERTHFKNVYLSEEDQRTILIHHFQQKEDKAIQALVAKVNRTNLTKDCMKDIAKWVSQDCKRLSAMNKQRLREALLTLMGKQHVLWTDGVLNNLSLVCHCYDNSGLGKLEEPIDQIYYASKAKNYFESQPEIPRWYHATKSANVQLIIDSGLIEVREAVFKGAWVSTSREVSYGENVFVFNHSIVRIDPHASIQTEWDKQRWRGLQKSIPLMQQINAKEKACSPHFILMGLPRNADKAINKIEKLRLFKHFENKGSANPKIVFIDFIDYLQSEIMKVLGSPNLPEKWWGKEKS